MKLSRILSEQAELSLSNTQKYILLAIKISQTPLLAFERVTDNESENIASEMLNNYNYINIYNEEAHLTDKGEEALISYGLTDETGEPTEMGQQIVDDYEEE